MIGGSEVKPYGLLGGRSVDVCGLLMADHRDGPKALYRIIARFFGNGIEKGLCRASIETALSRFGALGGLVCCDRRRSLARRLAVSPATKIISGIAPIIVEAAPKQSGSGLTDRRSAKRSAPTRNINHNTPLVTMAYGSSRRCYIVTGHLPSRTSAPGSG